MIKIITIRAHTVGLLFRDGDFRGLLDAGTHVLFDPLRRVEVTVASLRAPWLVNDKLDVIVKTGALADQALVLDLQTTSGRWSGLTAASTASSDRACTRPGRPGAMSAPRSPTSATCAS